MSRERLKADARQQQIVRAAINLAGGQDVENVTTLDMAQAVGVTQGAIFRHFPTKESIWIAVLRWAGSRLLSVTDAAASGGSHPLEMLERMFYAHVGFVAEHPAIPRLLFRQLQQVRGSKLTPLVREMMGTYRARLVELLENSKRMGLVRSDVDAQDAATLFIGTVQGLVIQSSIYGSGHAAGNMVQQARRVFPIFLEGIRARKVSHRNPSQRKPS